MSLSSGTRFGCYEIVSPIGAGGMGEVYRAKDTRLDREVAIKVLPSVLARDPERLARFEREAKVLAALNHRNIAHIYGVEGTGESQALVMELVEGSILVTPQPLDFAIRYALQIAEALEVAHEKGITHRDLKPGNIMVTPDGLVKVLDFGLASAPAGESSGNLANSPTMTMAAATQAGVILGTAAYMSPEQAAGKPVDKRSDIWSFGVVFYEMLTGARLFDGETLSHTLAHVLTRPVDLGKLPPGTPAPIRNLLQRCLDRDPKTRLRDIGEARVALAHYLADPRVETVVAPPAAASSRLRVLPWIIAAVALAMAAGLAWWHGRPSPPPPAVQFTLSAPAKTTMGTYGSTAFSPDGRILAFTTVTPDDQASEIWLRPIGSMEARHLPGTAGVRGPFWSPDGKFIGLPTLEGLKKISVDGGPPVVLAKNVAFGATWSQSGIILIGSMAGPLLQLPDRGGDATPALTLDQNRHESGQMFPQFLPDGRSFIYLSRAPNANAIYLGSLGSTSTRKILDNDFQARYAQGHLLFLRGETLMAQLLDPAKGQLTGSAFPVADKVGRMSAEIGVTLFSVSETGALATRNTPGATATLSVFDRKGQKLRDVGPPGEYVQITLSPDGKRLAVDRIEASSYDIWLLELSSGVFSRITFDPGNERDATFSPDGRQIVFNSDRAGGPHLYRKTLGGGPEELIYQGPNREAPEAWLKDGSILFGNFRGRKYFLLRPGERTPKLLYESDFTVDEPAISPDGKWIAYGSTESGRWEAYVARFPEWDERKQISIAGGMEPHWRGDGREIIYLASDSRLMSVSVKPGASLDAGSPEPLFPTNIRPSGSIEQWTMSADASRFYMPSPVKQEELPINVTLNWLSLSRK